MGGVRNALARALDGAIGGLSSVRDRIAPGSGDATDAGDRPDAGVRPGSAGDSDVTAGDRPRGDEIDPGGDLPTTDDGGAVPATDDGGLAGSVRGRVGTEVEYGKTALRHPVTAYRAHVESLAETPTLSTDFLKEFWVVGEGTKERRAERIHEHVASDRTLRGDTRAAVEDVDWSRTWRYGKYGFLAGRRYSEKIPVADRYAPVAGAVAGGAFGAVTGATDRTIVDVDPDRLFDRIDAVSRIREDPVTRARVARETVRAIDRRVGDDDLPVDELVDDEDVGRLVTREHEATPTEIPPGPGPSADRIEELIAGDPLPDPDRPPGLPPGVERAPDGRSVDEALAVDPSLDESVPPDDLEGEKGAAGGDGATTDAADVPREGDEERGSRGGEETATE